MALLVLSRPVVVRFCATPHHLGGASYGPGGELVFNKFGLGADWFERGITDEVVRLLIHEFGHEFSGDHLSADYHAALCRSGATPYALARRGEIWSPQLRRNGSWVTLAARWPATPSNT